MRTIISTIFIAFLCRVAPAAPARPDLHSLLTTRVPKYQITAANLLEAVSQLSSQFGIPIGIQWAESPTATKVINGSWTNAKVDDILRDIVAEDPSYELVVSRAVVHIHPRTFSRDPSDFLNIKLDSFVARDEYTRQIGFKLHDILNPTMTGRSAVGACAGSVAVGAGETKTSINLSEPRVLDVLDTILLGSNFSMWMVTFDEKTKYNGYIGTKSIWRSTGAADQPNWDFIPPFFDPVQMRYRVDWGYRN
jgi:hypothetical protein